MPLPQNIYNIMNLFPDLNIDGVAFADLWRAWRMTSEFRESLKDYEIVKVKEGDRWDLLSEAVYGRRDAWWVIALFNDIEDPFKLFTDPLIDSTIKELRILKLENLDLLLDRIRKKRIEFQLET